MLKISLVIPVFNSGKYLERCLDSIIKAFGEVPKHDVEYKKIEDFGEILAVDNGSSDDSLSILEEYKKKYPKLLNVLHCNTRGAGAARNYGEARVKGEYFWFIDADDTISPDSIWRLLEATDEGCAEESSETEVKKSGSKKADLVMLGIKKVFPNGKEIILSAIDASSPDYKSRFVRYGMGPTQFLIRRAWWDKHRFAFRETGMHEDVELMSSLILYTDRFTSVDKTLYTYYQNPGSVIYKKKWDKGYLDIFQALSGYYRRFEEMGMAEKYHDEIEWYFIWNLLIDSAKDFSKFPEGKEGFKRTREMLKKYFPKWRKNRFLKQKPLKLQIRVRLNYYKK